MAIPAHRAALVGTRLALSGAVLYLLEWVAIIAIPAQAPSQPGTPAAQVLADYAGHADGLAFVGGLVQHRAYREGAVRYRSSNLTRKVRTISPFD